MKKTVLGVFILLFCFSISPVSATWHTKSFGGSVTVEAPPVIAWYNASFGGTVTVEETPVVEYTWHTASFGGSITVNETAGSNNTGRITSNYDVFPLLILVFCIIFGFLGVILYDRRF